MMMSCFIGTGITSAVRSRAQYAFDTGAVGNNHSTTRVPTPRKQKQESLLRWLQCMEMKYICIVACAVLFALRYTQQFDLTLAMILVYEICVGGYRPIISSLRSHVIPHQYMATIVNIFRVPLNIIVVVVLINIEYLQHYILLIASAMLIICSIVAQRIANDIYQ
mmetsp:Transcript_38416/g.62959  ORF Transcript_38416/g.62959 Transcript_38416/m.62959 type:complete len:165 (-) Transcript_38416:43-537(-)